MRLLAVRREDLSPAQVAVSFVEEAGPAGVAAPELAARLGLREEALASVLKREAALLAVGREPVVYVASSGLGALADAVVLLLERFHGEQPLRAGMPREELRRRLSGRGPEAVFDKALGTLGDAGRVRATPDTVALASHAAVLGPEERKAQDLLLSAAESAGLSGVELSSLAERLKADRRLLERVARLLQEAGLLRRVGEGFFVPKGALDALVERVRARWPSGTPLDVAGFKEMTGLTRKHVIPLLEYLDRERVTRRVGALRTVL
jgi:selenocysteine-specific elongation factor